MHDQIFRPDIKSKGGHDHNAIGDQNYPINRKKAKNEGNSAILFQAHKKTRLAARRNASLGRERESKII